MSFYLDYSDSTNRANLLIIASITSLPLDKMKVAWREVLLQKRLNADEFSEFLDWMPDYLRKTKIKKRIKDVLYEEMAEASGWLTDKHIQRNQQNLSEELVANIPVANVVKHQNSAPSQNLPIISKVTLHQLLPTADLKILTDVLRALELIDNRGKLVASAKAGTLAGVIQCLIDGHYIIANKTSAFRTLQEVFGLESGLRTIQEGDKRIKITRVFYDRTLHHLTSLK